MNIDVGQASDSRALLPALGELPGHLLWRAHARVVTTIGTEVPADVDLHAYAVLLALADGAPRSQQALAEMVSVSRTTMVKVAADLAACGLVTRVRNPVDRRSYALTRTPQGAAAAQAWRCHAEELDGAVAASFAPREVAELKELLLLVVAGDLSAETPEALRGSLGFLLTRAHFRMHRDFLVALEPLGIEPRDYGTLTALAALGPVSQSGVAREIGVSGASMVEIVDGLEREGLVARHRLDSDRRAQVLHLQPEGEAVLDRADVIASLTTAHRLAPLTPRRATRLVRLLRLFVTAP